MIAQDYNSTHIEDSLLRQINIKERQLKIAKELNMLQVTEALQSQLLSLQSQLLESPDPQFEALMSLLDN